MWAPQAGFLCHLPSQAEELAKQVPVAVSGALGGLPVGSATRASWAGAPPKRCGCLGFSRYWYLEKECKPCVERHV